MIAVVLIAAASVVVVVPGVCADAAESVAADVELFERGQGAAEGGDVGRVDSTYEGGVFNVSLITHDFDHMYHM